MSMGDLGQVSVGAISVSHFAVVAGVEVGLVDAELVALVSFSRHKFEICLVFVVVVVFLVAGLIAVLVVVISWMIVDIWKQRVVEGRLRVVGIAIVEDQQFSLRLAFRRVNVVAPLGIAVVFECPFLLGNRIEFEGLGNRDEYAVVVIGSVEDVVAGLVVHRRSIDNVVRDFRNAAWDFAG